MTALKNFWSYISNGKYSVGCTGQTVFLYGKDGGELGRFKDLKYGYTPMISPDGIKFVVKSTEGAFLPTANCFFGGFLRGQSGGYVARFKDGQIQDTVEISESEHWFYRFFITLRLNGFTPKAHEWSLYPDYELKTLKTANHSLAKLYKHYHP